MPLQVRIVSVVDVSGRRRLAASTPPLAGKPADCLLEHRKVQPSVPQIRRRMLASSGTRITADVLVPTGQAISASTALQAASAQGEHPTAGMCADPLDCRRRPHGFSSLLQLGVPKLESGQHCIVDCTSPCSCKPLSLPARASQQCLAAACLCAQGHLAVRFRQEACLLPASQV